MESGKNNVNHNPADSAQGDDAMVEDAGETTAADMMVLTAALTELR